jgi:hypothetical protein
MRIRCPASSRFWRVWADGIELGRPAAGDYEVWAEQAIAGYAAQLAASGAWVVRVAPSSFL